MRKLYFSGVALIFITMFLALYGQYSIYRYPEPTVDPSPRPLQLRLQSSSGETHSIQARGAYLKSEQKHLFRAIQPDVSLSFDGNGEQTLDLILENIHPLATLQTDGIEADSIQLQQTGLTRNITINAPYPVHFQLRWVFPEKSNYRFVAIGDTGGDQELTWGLERAVQLGADFFLHLGDAYYDVSELDGVSAKLNQSAVPIYMANGNHDFQGPEGNAIDLFLDEIGPLNARFSLLGHCFINLDTGAFMYPANRGERAAMLDAEIVNHQRNPGQCSDYIVFTHKPMLGAFEAQFPQRDHSLYGRDARSLVKQLQQLGKITVIAGHIHNNFEFEQDGFKTYVTGSGLSHRDLLSGKPDAKLIVGNIERGQKTDIEWAFSDMPKQYHCSKRLYRGLVEAGSALSEVIEKECKRP